MVPILSACAEREPLEIGTARHGAVVVQYLDDHGGRRESCEAREIAPRFRVAGAGEHAAGLRHERKDMPGLAQILGPRLRRHGGLDRVRAIVRRDSGGHALGGLDRQGEVGSMRAVRLAHHERQPQLPAALAREREADEPAAVARHEIDVLGAHAVGRHDEIALVLAILIVHDHRHLAAAQVLENLVDRVHRCPCPPDASRACGMSRSKYRATTSISTFAPPPTASSPSVVTS